MSSVAGFEGVPWDDYPGYPGTTSTSTTTGSPILRESVIVTKLEPRIFEFQVVLSDPDLGVFESGDGRNS